MKQERLHLYRFIKTYNDLPQGQIEFQDNPDLRIITPSQVVGIEHTQLINGEDSRLKSREVLEERVVQKAQQFFEQSSNAPIYVYTYFSSHAKIHKRRVVSLAQSLADLVLRYLPEKGEQKEIQCWQLPHSFPAEIDSVYLYWYEKATYPLWAVPMGGFVPNLTPEIIEGRIRKKEKLLEKYLQNCDEVWLLLVLDGHTPSGNWDVPNAVLETKYMTGFSRVILYDYFDGSYNDLQLEDAPNHAFT
ncbi:MAG: hypothetical protein D6732_21325 [Methanobacteriota archaeon]|nr:MAG: hypothetical protein D6732_21325 [Euryarchaeota archaeon]